MMGFITLTVRQHLHQIQKTNLREIYHMCRSELDEVLLDEVIVFDGSGFASGFIGLGHEQFQDQRRNTESKAR